MGWLTTVDHKRIARRYFITALRVLRAGGPAGARDAPAARARRQHAGRARPVQPALLAARLGDDVPVRRADHAGGRHLSRAADGRHTQHRVRAIERLQLLDLSVRRH